ncbi:type VI secretion system tube protein TssD [Paraburkholderia sp.]|uniref:type VI secretion system tube protein TssD n=1 Tax=Paraburkholderia sp. TaxID=1926495 RepID=UPI002F3FDA43
MAIPLHLWLTDQDGTLIRGSSAVIGREGSIEILSLAHGMHAPADRHTGKLMGGRSHRPLTIEKEIDKASPVLYRVLARGMTLQSAELKWYRINEGGWEEEYFNMLMRNVKVVSVSPRVPNIKEQINAHRNHFEVVELAYEEIQWSYLDGNLIFKDAWNLI